ncbi:hypothetical protein AUJ46_04220 [Candidatus Peregrinibacteria bacterium CG1_02_54_53]|nr:MAG: hypothetical protein AUJ46_04220 [Candidatus Peregrinibacteria bacterium CG1_02_54_53]
MANRNDIVTLADGVQMLLDEGGDIDTSGPVGILHRGNALIRSAGIVQLRTSACDILAMAGAFHVVAGDSGITVSAISTPVLLSTFGRRAIVPPGQQMRIAGPLVGLEAGVASWQNARETASLPEYFFKEQFHKLQKFPPAVQNLPALQSAMPSDEPVMPAVQLPAAQERAKEARRLEILRALRGQIEQRNDDGARAILSRPAFRTALADGRGLSVLVTLAAQVEDGAAGLRPLLLQFLADRHDLWLLAALHPMLHTGAWVSGLPQLTQEEQLLLAFDLPKADRSPQGFSPVVTRWWEHAVSALIAEEHEPLALVEPLLTALLPVTEQDIVDGYPERAQTLVRALEVFADPVRDQLSPKLKSSLSDLAQRIVPHVELFPSASFNSSSSISAESSASSAPSSFAPIDPQQRVQTVELALEQAGALFSLQTTLKPLDDGQSVAVRNILFSSSKGDILYAFDVNVRTNEVSSIVQDGTIKPYPMKLEAFLRWVRQ